MYIDTHCHLSVEDYDDIDLVIKENRDNKISKIIISGCTKESIIESLELANKYEDIYLTIGYHPSEVNTITDEDLELLEEQIKSSDKVVGVGEIGLDYHYGKEDSELQKKLFRKQMKLAQKLNLPVVIHSRDATLDTINILKEFPQVIGDIHCFSGSVETAKIYIAMGYKIGIENIILETDAPYLAPVPVRGKKNSSKYIPYIAERVSEILNISVDKVAKISTDNAVTLFDLK